MDGRFIYLFKFNINLCWSLTFADWVAPKGAVFGDGCSDLDTHSLLVLEDCNSAFITSCFLDFCPNLLPVVCNRRVSSSATFFFLSSCSTNTVAGCTYSCSCGVEVDMRTTFFAASCLPPSNQKDVFLFIYSRFPRSQSRSPSCRFSTKRRFFAASQRLIFLWK